MKRTKPAIRKFCFHDQNRARVSEIEALTNISNTPCETMIKSMKRDNSREGRKICRWQRDETKKGWLIDGSLVLIIVLRYIYIYILDSENIENGNGPKLTSHLTFRMKTGSVHVSKGRFSTRRQMFSRGCRGIEAGDDRTVLCHDGDFNLLDEIVKNCFESCCITLRMGTKGTMFDCYAGIKSGKYGRRCLKEATVYIIALATGGRFLTHGSGLLFMRVVYIMPCEINLLHVLYRRFELTLEKDKIKEREI